MRAITKRFPSRVRFLGLAAILSLLSAPALAQVAMVATDKEDYAPFETVVVTGTGFQAGETVTLTFHEMNRTSEDRTGTTVADSAGNISYTGFSPNEGDVGILFLMTATGPSGSFAQFAFTDSLATDCYRTVASGNWNSNSTWESAPILGGCTTWTAATMTPLNTASTITIRTGHTVTVTASISVDQVVVDLGGQVDVNSGVVLTVQNPGAGVDLADNGIVNVAGTLTSAASSGSNEIAVGGAFNVLSTGTLNGFPASSSLTVNSGGSLSVASGGSFTGSGQNSQFIVNSGGTATIGGSLSNLGQFIVNGQANVTGSVALASISNLHVTSGGNLSISGTGTVSGVRGNGGTVIVINGGGTATLSDSATISPLGASTSLSNMRVCGTAALAGSNGPACLVSAVGGTLILGPNSKVAGQNFELVSGGNLKVGSVDGIRVVADGAIGNVQTTVSRSFSTGANYTYNGVASQVTGTGLPIAPLTVNSLTSNNPTLVTLTNTLSVTNSLAVQSGIFDEGAAANVTVLGGLNISLGATYRSLGVGDLTLGPGGVSNSGTIQLNASGVSCGSPDDILIRSNVALPAGTYRPWSGAGTFDLADVDVKDQGGSALITVQSGTNSGNNDSNWTISSTCGPCAGQPDGTSCSDGDACNGAETCQAQVCTPGTPVVTDDSNACTTDACDPATGIVTHTAIVIDDNNACTTDACDPATGTITHTAVNINDNNACTTDSCDPITGVHHVPVSVDDGNACTTDACDPATGIVTHTAIVIDDNNACTTDACDPATGTITHTAVNINDNNACTTDSCDPITGVHHVPVSVDDGNACTVDACDPATGNITHTPLAAINDNNACTVDACDPATGTITHTPLAAINDGNACTTDACDPATGNITHTAVTPVSDNNACTIDTCDPATGNTIHTPVNINDNNACTVDACDPATGNITHTPLAAINDGNACTTDACDPATGNITHTAVSVDDGNACTTDACDPATGNITHTAVSVDDGNACTTDSCDPVTGVHHTAVSVDDGNACTTDSCDPATGVHHTPVNINDNNACTVDACDPATGTITHTPLAGIDDGNACTTDACDPATGNITHTPVSVDDGNACTTDSCDPATGVHHTPVSVDDGNACTTDSCDPATGVHHTPVSVDDGNACTTDSCDPVTGVHHTPVSVDDGNACTVDACDPATGTITHTAVNINDNNACTTDACDPATGNITHTPVNTSDGNACTIDSCNPATGYISHTPIPIDDGDACTTDACDPATGNITHTNNNVPPVVTSTSGPNPLALSGNSVTVTANFTDANTFNTHTCSIAWDDATTSVGTVSESGGSGTCTGTHHYAATGVYNVTFTITDSCGGTASAIQYVVIYDGGAGFVTGGGWINSPLGAYVADPALTGKATFGFVSKYKSGMTVPTGETEFNFKVADFNFHSVVYEWMVISGSKARYRGTGTINGTGSYGFELTAWDGGNSGDKFRIKIWDTNQGNAVVYDNQMNAVDGADPTTTLGGGSIVIHK